LQWKRALKEKPYKERQKTLAAFYGRTGFASITSVLTPLLMAMIVDTLLHRHSNPDTPLSSKKCLYIVIYVKAVSTVEEAGRCQAQAHEIT
jgi:hypothetical protein